MFIIPVGPGKAVVEPSALFSQSGALDDQVSHNGDVSDFDQVGVDLKVSEKVVYFVFDQFQPFGGHG
jgi:hypothetical protein